MSANSNRGRATRKSTDRPDKPFPEFELYAHPLGYWSKKVNGKILHFGRWGRMVKGKIEPLAYEENWRAARQSYQDRIEDAKKGRIRESVVQPGGKPGVEQPLTVKDLCNKFLNAKRRKLEAGGLTLRSHQELRSTADRLASALGSARLVTDISEEDFENLRADIAKGVGPVRLGNEITRIRSIFKYATKNRLVEVVHFGSEFEKPDKSEMRRHKATRDKKLFTPAELLLMLQALEGTEVTLAKADEVTGEPMKATLKADINVRAFVLLGINAGVGNSDISGLCFSHLDLDGAWLLYPRPKTGIDRRIPLWPETVAAVKAAIAARPIPKDKTADRNIVFLTRRSERYVRVFEKSRTDGVTNCFGKLLRALKINGRQGLGFYSLRHTFATIGLQTGDRDAVKSLMGHAFGDVLATYDEAGPSDDRLRAVTDHIRRWLFGSTLE